MENTRKIGFYNHKGGVAKSSSVINVTYFLQKMGKKILVVDCDSQENSFSFYSIGNIVKSARPSKYENVFYMKWDFYSDSEGEGFDFIIFDLPPTMSDEVKKIIKQCDFVFVPTILGAFEASGLPKVTDEIRRQGTALGGVFVTMYNLKRDSELYADFKTFLHRDMLDTAIPYSETVRESQKYGLALEEYFNERKTPNVRNTRKVAFAYEDLTNEILRRCEQ